MSDSKHTPGPWHVEGVFVFPAGYRSNPICGVNRYLGQVDAQIGANARLIAAAPDLLEVLKEAHVIAADAQLRATYQRIALERISELVQAAIAKAEGK